MVVGIRLRIQLTVDDASSSLRAEMQEGKERGERRGLSRKEGQARVAGSNQ